MFVSDDLSVHHSRCSDRDCVRSEDEVRDPRRSVVSGRRASAVQEGGDAGKLPQHRNQQPLHGHAIHQVRFLLCYYCFF